MRFAYIDSHGNEVPIPSVDALALRIELGAIGPDTELYDAQADTWGPARTHEIFHTLSRDADDEGFVAPPPPVAPTPPSAPPPPEPEETPTPTQESAPVEAEGEFDLGLTLAEAPPPAEEEPEAPAGEPDDLALDLAPPAVEAEAEADFSFGDTGPLTPDEPPADRGSGAVEGMNGGFDFGDLGEGLEVEDAPMDIAAGPGPPDFGGGMELETEMEFMAPSEGLDDSGSDLSLEKPMSEFQPDSPPGWMESPASDGDDVMDFSTVSAEAVTEEATAATEASIPPRQRRSPRDRPSPPKFKKQRSMSTPIVLVVGILALGVGGYVGWPILSARLAERSAPERPAVVMPAIPDDLLPRMRSTAEAAMADVLQDVARQTASTDAPAQPDDDWLAGVYLGNASQFPGIEAFWTSIGNLVDGVREAEWQRYHDRYVERLQADGADAETAALLTERADSGFVAAADARQDAYGAMDQLVTAALDLHDFLLMNESNIEYRPASTSTADPVLEAVPSSATLGDEMWGRVDDVTDALSDLGASYPFTRERLTAALLTRLQQAGIQ